MSKYIANSVQVPNAFFDEIMSKLSDAALRCYLVITRQTTGWQKQHDAISISQFVKKTGKSKPTVIKGCEELEKLGLICKVEKKNRISEYSLNLSNHFTSQESLLVKNIDSSCQESLQEVVKTFDTQKPNKPTNTKPNKKINKKSETKSEKSQGFKPKKPDDVSDQVWVDLLAHRKSKKCSETQTAWNVIFNQLAKAQEATGHNLDNIISEWLSNDWKGFKAQWYVNAQQNQKPKLTGNQTHANTQSANRSTHNQNQYYATEADFWEEQMLAEFGYEQSTNQPIRTVN